MEGRFGNRDFVFFEYNKKSRGFLQRTRISKQLIPTWAKFNGKPTVGGPVTIWAINHEYKHQALVIENMRFLKNLFFLLVVVIFLGCKKEGPISPVIDSYKELNSDYWGIDTTNNIIVYNGNSISIVNRELTIGNITLKIETDDKTILIGKAYRANFLNEDYELYYTQLPIVSITTNAPEILDEPKIFGELKLLESYSKTFNSFIGIELRGGVSQNYPKKSYSIELWQDESGDSKLKESLLGMRVDDDWILDGMWNEPNRIRDFISHEIWLEIGRVQNPTSKTKIGISRKYCELFLNGNYSGIYYLGEKIDRKQLDLEKYDNQINGELYKGYTWEGGVTFTGLTGYDNSQTTWNGYEAKYPEDVGVINWLNLYNHVDFIINSSQSDFNSEISTRIDMKNAIDYYIFLNLIYATDNTGKNMYTCKIDKSSLYFFTAWDMDGTFGNNWKGERVDITNIILSNGLYDKLLDYPIFKEDLKQRWMELRNETLDSEKLIKKFIDYNEYLVRNAIHIREAQIPELSQNYSEEEINYIESWIRRRVNYLDEYFIGL